MSSTARTILSVALLSALAALSVPAQAKSVKDFEAMRSADQAEYMVSFLEKMTYDIGQKNPELAQRIKDYFVRDQPGKPVSAGIEQVNVQLAVVDLLAKKGKADLSKIEIEAIVVYVTKRAFEPAAGK